MLSVMDQTLPGDMPITLVIKAPNQRMADHTVECMLGWTIRKLKQHLESAYPSKPKHNEQRLIYSGKLLQDHLTLKEILRQIEGCEEPTRHTVHLVCSSNSDSSVTTGPQSATGPKKSSTPEPVPESASTPDISSTTTSRQQVTTSMPENQAFSSDGIRYRGAIPPSSVAQGYSYYTMAGDFTAASYPSFGGNPAGYTPDQYNWLMQQQQQAYAQYMAQYMQYYQSMYFPGQPFDPQVFAAAAYMQQNQGTPAQERPQPLPNQAPAAAPAPNNANNMPRMNAQGGMDEDDNDDLEPRDWLHHVYFLMRCLTFLGLLFFYSNLTRFLLVFSGTVVIYFLQKIKRRMQQVQEERRQAQEQEQQQQQQQQQQPDNPDRANDDIAGAANGGNDGGDARPEAEPVPEPEAAQTLGAAGTGQDNVQPPVEEGHWIVRFCAFFFMTVQAFFTSLLPTPPELLEAN